nr:hypothetical protein [Natrinema sp. SYSU A 869]
MDEERAVELAPSIKTELRNRADGTYDEIIVNVGGAYKQALEGATAAVDADVHYIEGDGIGHKGHVLKQIVRGETVAGDDSSVRTAVGQ